MYKKFHGVQMRQIMLLGKMKTQSMKTQEQVKDIVNISKR